MKEKKNTHIPLKDLEVYKQARELSRAGWDIYVKLSWKDRKIIGDQFITATDSYGANIAEGYGRYHFLDKIKFFYNARDSLAEANEYWLQLLKERKMIPEKEYDRYNKLANDTSYRLQNFINALYRARNNLPRQ